MATALTVVIIGAGLGGLSCAIQCRRWGLKVVVLERAKQIVPVGAGIQIPPNGARVLSHYGLLCKIQEKATQLDSWDLRRYADGRILNSRPFNARFREEMGGPWIVIHREDYHRILFDEAIRLGAEIRLDTDVADVDTGNSKVFLKKGEVITGDAIIGADGLWSVVRKKILGRPSLPYDTGDLAYRATMSQQKLHNLRDPEIDKLSRKKAMTIWLGPNRHCVFYPIRDGTEFNLVLIRPDNLPAHTRTMQGDLGEMEHTFEGWDATVRKILTCVPSVLKWKLQHLNELERWAKNCTTLLGDACHPTLPYHAQGAAMAVEDGAVIGLLLGLLNSHSTVQNRDTTHPAKKAVPAILEIYERLRKQRTTVNVQGAVQIRWFNHLPDGPEQERRDKELSRIDWSPPKPSPYIWCDSVYQKELLAHDSLGEARSAFELWWNSSSRYERSRL